LLPSYHVIVIIFSFSKYRDSIHSLFFSALILLHLSSSISILHHGVKIVDEAVAEWLREIVDEDADGGGVYWNVGSGAENGGYGGCWWRRDGGDRENGCWQRTLLRLFIVTYWRDKVILWIEIEGFFFLDKVIYCLMVVDGDEEILLFEVGRWRRKKMTIDVIICCESMVCHMCFLNPTVDH